MAKIIQDIWIIASSGIVVFERVFDEKLSPQLFGMLLKALDSMAGEISKGGLTNFELKQKRFSIIKKKEFMFIANSSRKTKVERLMDELQFITEKFVEIYPQSVLDNWNNNINVFSGFLNEIDKSVEEKVKGFLKRI